MGYGHYNHQGYFGESFVRVLASAAGLIAGQQDVDATGVDFSIDLPGHMGTCRYPKIEAQVKSWCNPRGTEDAWHYPMAVRHFNKLAGPDFFVSRFLFLVIVPSDVDLFAYAGIEALQLRHCGYWVSLADQEPISHPQRSTTVHVPKRNILTPVSLRHLMGLLPAQRSAS